MLCLKDILTGSLHGLLSDGPVSGFTPFPPWQAETRQCTKLELWSPRPRSDVQIRQCLVAKTSLLLCLTWAQIHWQQGCLSFACASAAAREKVFCVAA